MMKILIYEPPSETPGPDLTETISRSVPKAQVIACRTADELCRHLRRPSGDCPIILIRPARLEHLEWFVAFADLFSDRKLLLALPEGGERALSLGLRLKPKFTARDQGDWPDLAAVIEHLINREMKEKEGAGNERGA